MNNRHKIAFEMRSFGEDIYCYMEVEGKLSHKDYEFFVPAFEQTIQNLKEPKIRLLVNIFNFEGWDLHAAWDDLKFGLNHEKEFTKIAVVGQSSFYEYGVIISNWFMSSQVKYFEDLVEAKDWLLSN